MYIITARRMTSGELLKYRKGLFITAGYESLFPGSSRSRFILTVPQEGIANEGKVHGVGECLVEVHEAAH